LLTLSLKIDEKTRAFLATHPDKQAGIEGAICPAHCTQRPHAQKRLTSVQRHTPRI